MYRRTLIVALALSVAMLAACGGGGSKSSPDCPPPGETARRKGARSACVRSIRSSTT